MFVAALCGRDNASCHSPDRTDERAFIFAALGKACLSHLGTALCTSFHRTKAIKKPRTEPGLKFTFQRGTNRCLHNGPEYDARYNCSRSIKRRCQDFSHVAVQKSCSGTNRPSEPETSAARSSLALTFSAGGDGGRRSPEIPTQSVDPNAAVMACEVSRPTRTTLLRRKPNFALSKSRLPSRLPRRRVLRRLFPN